MKRKRIPAGPEQKPSCLYVTSVYASSLEILVNDAVRRGYEIDGAVQYNQGEGYVQRMRLVLDTPSYSAVSSVMNSRHWKARTRLAVRILRRQHEVNEFHMYPCEKCSVMTRTFCDKLPYP